MRHPNKPRHENIRGKGEISDDGLTLSTWLQRCVDDELTIPVDDNRMVANIFLLKEKGTIMYCTEFLCDPKNPWTPVGPLFSYEARKVEG